MSDSSGAKPSFPTYLEMLGVNRRHAFVAVALLVLAGLAVWQGPKQYRHWKATRLDERCTQLKTAGKWQEAALVAHEALRCNPASLPATRVMANLALRQPNPMIAIPWFKRLAELEPGKAEHRLTWASLAVRAQDTASAGEALAGVPAAAQQTAVFHELAGSQALALKQFARAEPHFKEALRLNPGLSSARFNLAQIGLWAKQPAPAQAARVELQQLRQDTNWGVAATRLLRNDAARRGDAAAEEPLARALVENNQGHFEDWLHWLHFLWRTSRPEYRGELGRLQQASAGNPDAASKLALWMVGRDQAKAALTWLNSLPEQLRRSQPLAAARAECLDKTRDWAGLQAVADEADWFGLEFMREAIRSRVMEQTGNLAGERLKWSKAVAEAGGETARLEMLAGACERWGWAAKAELIWWQLSQRPATKLNALGALFRHHSQRGNAVELLRVAEAIHQLDVREPIAANNVAYLRLLLKTKVAEAAQLTRANLANNPEWPDLILTAALAEARTGNPTAALALLKKIPSVNSDRASDLVCRGLVLVAAGQRAEAEACLRSALKAGGLLDEEKALAEEALRPPGLP